MSRKKLKSKITYNKDDDDISFDQAKRAEMVLDYFLTDENQEIERLRAEASKVDVKKERVAAPVLEPLNSDRASSRVLFITKDTTVLEADSKKEKDFIELQSVFDEVHVMVLTESREPKETAKRVGSRVWLYRAASPYWWFLGFAARNIAKEQLEFNNSFRPDIVVALDPFESGLAGLMVARAYDRPFQVHISEDLFSKSFLKKHKRNPWRQRIAKYVLKRTKSVRTTTDTLKEVIHKRFKRITDIALLPHFYNFAALMEAKPSFDVHEKYPDFVFVILTIAPLTADSTLHDTISAVKNMLFNPRIGLIVIGEGPAKKLFEDKVKILGIERNVVFITNVSDMVSYFKTSDLLIETGISAKSEEEVLRAAAAGLPMILSATKIREDLFTDGESAYICPDGDVHCITQKLNKFLNQSAERVKFALAGKLIIKQRVHESPESYYTAFRDSIEAVLQVEESHH